MKRILVPTDFSITAEKAFQFAMGVAEKANGSVVLYHNYLPVENHFIDTAETRKQYNAETETNLKKLLQRLKQKVKAIYKDVPVSTILGRSPLIYDILDIAKQNKIDLIVMGTQGASGLKKTILGTVAARIVKSADIPVLLVPKKFRLKEPEQIVFAADCRKTDKQILSLIFSMAKLYSAKVTVMHLCSEQEAESEKANFDSYALAMQNQFSDFTLNFQLIKTTSAIESLKNLYKEMPCDLVVMIRRNKPFWERFFRDSFTEHTAYATHLPLLVVPEKKVG